MIIILLLLEKYLFRCNGLIECIIGLRYLNAVTLITRTPKPQLLTHNLSNFSIQLFHSKISLTNRAVFGSVFIFIYRLNLLNAIFAENGFAVAAFERIGTRN